LSTRYLEERYINVPLHYITNVSVFTIMILELTDIFAQVQG